MGSERGQASINEKNGMTKAVGTNGARGVREENGENEINEINGIKTAPWAK